MNREVIEAFKSCITVPLGGETAEEYDHMKTVVLHSLDIIAKAGNLEEELKEAFKTLIEQIQSPEFMQYVTASLNPN